MSIHEIDSLDTELIELEGPSDEVPAKVSESVLHRRELLRELYRQSKIGDNGCTKTSSITGEMPTP